MEVAFEAYGGPLETVTALKYLGRILMASDEDWPAVVTKLCKDRKRWARLSQIIGREGKDPWSSGTFYKAVVQATILFGAETLVMSPIIRKTLVGFHHRVDFRLEGMPLRWYMTVRWV